MLKTDILFGNNMVLQRDRDIMVWGEGKPLSTVEVTIQGQKVSSACDQDGKWKVTLKPLKTSFSETMIIRSGEETLTYNNVQVGDVWLAGGQSNMEFLMKYDIDIEKERTSAVENDIRFFDYPKVSYAGQINERDYMKCFGYWQCSDPENLQIYSAVAYYFAKYIKKQMNIPVGILGCNWGGTCIASWMTRESISDAGHNDILDEYDKVVAGLDMAAYEARFQMLPDSYRVTPFANPMIEMLMYGATTEELQEKLKEAGVDLSAGNMADFLPQLGPKSELRPAGLYEAMLLPIAEYKIAGVLWYQGESDGDVRREGYDRLLKHMIIDWRNLFGKEIPFIVMQLPPFGTWMTNDGNNYVSIRASQQKVSDDTEDVYLATISDGGEKFNIHPRNKAIAGQRMALIALNYVYKKTVGCEAPRLRSAVLSGQSLELNFDYAYEGLSIPDSCQLPELSFWNESVEIKPEIKSVKAYGNTVYIELADAPGEVTGVSLGYSGWFVMNILNSEKIPARPGKIEL